MSKISKKIVISWLLVILWTGFIFSMSNMNTNESNVKSKQVINEVIKKQ